MTFEQPSNDFFKSSDYNGHLIIVENIGAPYRTNTNFGETDAIKADVTVLTDPAGPKEFRQTQVFGAAMVGTLSRASTGAQVLGRIGQGVAKQGQSAPWVINPWNPGDEVFAQSYVEQRNAARAAQQFQPAPQPAPAAPAYPQVPQAPQVPQVPQVPQPAAPQPVAPAAPAAPAYPQVPQVPQVPQPVAPQPAAPAPVAPAPVAAAPAVDATQMTAEQWQQLPPHVQQQLAAGVQPTGY